MSLKFYQLKIFIVFFALIIATTAFAQSNFNVKGQVTDRASLPIPGVSIKIKGQKTVSITDRDGRYVIPAKRTDTLVFTYIGYKTIEQEVAEQTTINITLDANEESLNEVVVVAFGTQKKVTITGALTTVKGEDLAKSPNTNLAQTLVGRTSGLIAQQNTGQPGNDGVSLRIRGSSTFNANSAPLVLVDGVERPFNSINAEEVDNVTILKDAATTAVYGIRGANGVILVTTKRGSTGQPKFSFSTNYAVQAPTRLPELTNAYDYGVLYNEAIKNDNPLAPPLYTADDLQKYKDGSDPVFHPDIDWFDFMMKKTAPQSKNTLTVNGGGQLAKYFISLGYVNQSGLWKEFNEAYGYSNNTTYKRYNFRSSIDFNVSKTTVLGISLGGYSDKYHTSGNPFGAIQNAPPGGSPALIDGKLMLNSFIVGRNPLLDISAGYDERFVSQFNLTADLNQKLDKIINGLSFRSKLGYDSDYRTLLAKDVTRATYTPLKMVVGGVESVVFQQARDEVIGGISTQSFDSRSKRIYFESALQYNRSFGKHNVGGLVLYNQNKQYWPSNSAYTVEYPEIAIGYLGAVGRVTYNYDLRYLLEASVGRNGSENFPKGKRYGTFPAVSMGWNVTNEPFVKKIFGEKGILSQLKFKASYGETGNDKIIDNNNIYQRFMYFPSEYTFAASRAQLGEDLRSYEGVVEGQLGNSDITWEKAIKQNYAVEASFFKDKLNLKFDYFLDSRNNILYQKASIAHVAAAVQDVYNIAQIKNKGYEIEMGWNGKAGNVNYFINGNYTFARNRIIENGTIESPQNQLGNSLNQTYGLISNGFFNTQAEANAWPLQYSSVPTPGDARYMDTNNDGKVDQNDFVPIGDPTFPEINYGVNFGLSVKGFDVSVLFQGAENVSRVLSGFMQRPANQYGSTLAAVLDERWTPENAANATRPKLTATYGNANNYVNSTVWMRDASYLRLKNVELGYRFNGSFLKKAGLNSARLFLSGQNLVTWDKLKIVDPEQQASNSFAYPQLQIFNVGLNIQF
ncbi:TonB-dependent receptor [Pedobacter frigiditerrae]|uniref:TonB-dependent receptor n=1 Tax=Pedobacter frigiditerrae TaxID=2530452 RepID=A0A4V6N5N8_9SPHI|nr:TonB-dependent receptor [Pedobacter frigiditerrae]TCC88576.1 TonB-dependent receptor [Pedobacter frigiditerrae]